MGNNPNGTKANGRPEAAHHGACSYGNTARGVTKTVANMLVPGAELRMRPQRGCACPLADRRSHCAVNRYGVVDGFTGVEAESWQPLSQPHRP